MKKQVKSWYEYLGDFSLKSPILSFGDLANQGEQIISPAKRGMWDCSVQLTVPADAAVPHRNRMASKLLIRHIAYEHIEPEWTSSTVLFCTSGWAGIWDRERWEPDLIELAIIHADSVAAACLLESMGTFGVTAVSLPTSMAVLLAMVDGETIAAQILFNDRILKVKDWRIKKNADPEYQI